MKPLDILWVGPGPRPKPLWRHIFDALLDAGTLPIGSIEYLDVSHRPQPLYSRQRAQRLGFSQRCRRGDLFEVRNGPDVIILDFIEAWRDGPYEHSLVNGVVPPYAPILRKWTDKLRQLAPYQVWVTHNFSPRSTIIPDLQPAYRRVIYTTLCSQPFFGLDIRLTVDDEARFWSNEAAWIAGRGSGLDVWQADRPAPR